MRKLASIQKIIDITPIEGADKIELVKLLGWQCVSKKGEFKINDLCVYFELDSIIPRKPWSEFLFKTTSDSYRLRSVKLKGALSQGLALPITILKEYGDLIKNDKNELVLNVSSSSGVKNILEDMKLKLKP